MSKVASNSYGFGVISFLTTIIVIGFIGLMGWYVYHSLKNINTIYASATKISTEKGPTFHKIKKDNGWLTFCSSYGGLCLQYPPDWNLVSVSIPEQSAPNQSAATTTEAQITSPTGDVTVEYNPSCVLLTAPPTGSFTDYVQSVTSPANTSDFKIVKSIEIAQYASTKANSNAGVTTNVYENFYLTSNANVKQYAISVGTHTTSLDNEAAAGFFVNPKTPQSSNLQCINVGSLKNANGSNYVNFTRLTEGQAWFDNTEVQTAGQILSTVTYN